MEWKKDDSAMALDPSTLQQESMSTTNNNNDDSVITADDNEAAAAAAVESWDAGSVDNFPWLYVGSLSAAESHKHLRMNNITRILTVARNLPIRFPPPENIHHYVIEIDDHPRANFLNIVVRCRSILQDAANDAAATDNKSRILVHCASGVSRSVTAIISWLMMPTKRGGGGIMSLEKALKAIRKNRSHANPNIGFQCQMQILEKYNGDIIKAINEWKSSTVDDVMERARVRRQEANEVHAAVDDLEVQIQRHRSLIRNAATDVIRGQNDDEPNYDSAARATTASNQLINVANRLIDRMDTCEERTEGLPEDRVAVIVFNSARIKLERLTRTLNSEGRRKDDFGIVDNLA